MSLAKSFNVRHLPLALCALLVAGAAGAEVPTPSPMAGSPGAADRTLAVRDGCPTFSWSEVEGPREYEIATYRVLAGGIAGDAPLLHTRIEGAFLSWTPSLDECLSPGRYAWVVRAQTAAGWSDWSEPRLFEVRGSTPDARRPAVPEPAHKAGATGSGLDGHSTGAVEFHAAAPEPLFMPAPADQRRLTGAAFAPPSCNGSIFSDVNAGNPNCAWIELLAADQIAQACDAGRFCPDHPVTRGQMAALLERSMRGTDTWRAEQGDGAVPNLPPAPPGITPLDTEGYTGAPVGQYTSITIGADGLGLISYYDTSGALTVAHCSNINCTEATITPIEFTSGFTYYTSITIGADGFGLISYYNALGGALMVAHCANVQCTSVDTKTPLDIDGDVGQYASITIGVDGLGLISYYDATNDALRVAHCSNLKCTTATFATLDTSGGTSTSIAIGGDGVGHISYRHASGQLAVARCANVNCTGASWISFPYDILTPGSYTSIATGADGLELVSFYVGIGDKDLHIGHCNNPACSAFDTGARVEMDIPASLHTSLTIGSDGLGLVSYHVAATGDLKVAHCGDIGCSSISMGPPLDTAGLVGEFNSITIGSDGLGLISYYDATNGDLKVAHCSNVLCAPYFRRR